MQSTEVATTSVALVYQSQAMHQHLRSALDELGARVVYESSTSAFDRSALDACAPQVVVINLDPQFDDAGEQIDDLLVDDTLRVIVNDGEVSSKLSGWDLARWARHLASKVMGGSELLPARPEGSLAVPVRNMPQHALDTADKPQSLHAPIVTFEAEQRASEEITRALDSFGIAEVAEVEEAVEVSDGGEIQARDELAAALEDFGFFSEQPVISVNQLVASDPNHGSGLDAIEFAIADDVDVAAEVAGDGSSLAPAASSDDTFVFDFDDVAEGDALQDLAVESVTDSAQPVQSENAFDEISFDFDEPSMAPRSEAVAGLDEFLQQNSFQSADETVELPVPEQVVTVSRKPAVDVDQLMSGLSFELSPFEDDARVEEVPTPVTDVHSDSTTNIASNAELASDFDDILSSLSLTPMDDDGAQSSPNAPADAIILDAPAEAEIAASDTTQFDAGLEANPFAGLSFTLEEMEAPVVVGGSEDRVSEMVLSDGSTASARQPVVDEMTAAFSRVWVLGASIGGPDAVREFLAGVPKNTQNVFLLAQHMGADFIDLMVSQLAKATSLDVRMASAGESAMPGQVLVVPLSERLLLERTGEVRVIPLDEPSPYSPSIDRVLMDVADRFGAKAGAIIFSGMAHDAIDGARYLANKGGTVWVQDPSTCVVSSMIDGAIEAGIVKYQGGPGDLAKHFAAECG